MSAQGICQTRVAGWQLPDTMNWIPITIMALALLQGGWLLLDGGRALVRGDYFTPRAGPRAGQLGPWARLVAAVGFGPRSTFMKVVHVLLGAAWLTAAALWWVRPDAGWWGVLGCAMASLWYLPMGTLLSLIQLALLLCQRSHLIR
jgi:hypothetical protein